jgi:hypothetical protein
MTVEEMIAQLTKLPRKMKVVVPCEGDLEEFYAVAERPQVQKFKKVRGIEVYERTFSNDGQSYCLIEVREISIPE